MPQELVTCPAVAHANLTSFTSESASIAAKLSHLPGKRKPRVKPEPRLPAKRQAVELQNALYKAGLCLLADVKECEDKEERARVASALASVAKGWQSMTDQLRILAGKPLPGSRRPPPDQPKAKVKSAPKPAPMPAPGSVKNPDSQV